MNHIFFFNIWAYIDDFIRNNINLSYYNSANSSFIIDYQYFDFIELIYYNPHFNDITLHWMFYYDFLMQYCTIEDDEHELFAFISTYLVPLEDKVYIIETFYPDETDSNFPLNLYDINDLYFEFSFFYEKHEYDSLMQIYEKYNFYFIDLYYKQFLHSNSFLQTLLYNNFTQIYEKNILNYFFLEKERKETFRKKRNDIPFEILPKPSEYKFNSDINYVKWFKLVEDYNYNQFKLKMYTRLVSYNLFDKNYYLVKTSEKLINTDIKYSQFYEVKDEYFLEQKNRLNLFNYYYNQFGFMFDYKKNIKFLDNKGIKDFNFITGLSFNFYKYNLIIEFLLCIFLTINYIIFFFLTCWFLLSYSNFIFDYDFNFSYIRSLTRSRVYNNFSDFNDLIFDESVYLNLFI